MNENFTVRKATENDITLIENLIKGLAAYEKRPQDMTATQEDLRYLLFEKNIAAALIAELNGERRICYLLPRIRLICGKGRSAS